MFLSLWATEPRKMSYIHLQILYSETWNAQKTSKNEIRDWCGRSNAVSERNTPPEMRLRWQYRGGLSHLISL